MNKPIKPNMPQKFKETQPREVIERQIDLVSLITNGECSFEEMYSEAVKYLGATPLVGSLKFRVRRENYRTLLVGLFKNENYEAELQDYNGRKAQNDFEWAEYKRLMSENAKELVAFEIHETEQKLKRLKESLSRVEKKETK